VKRTIAPYSGFVGSQRVAYLGNRGKIEKDLQDLARVVPSGFDPNAMVTIDFKDASLNYILDQLLGGALGVNFVAPKDLPKDIDFRTETPIPKSRVVQVVRDLLARHNLIMALTDGVYQIGSPQVIKALRDNSAAGRSGQQVVRVVKLGKGNAERVAALASRLIPETQNVVIAPTGDSIIVRADPNDVYAIADLLTTLSHTTVGNNKMAIIPLKRSAPEAVATQLSAFYC
jgi:general secretion pathway protein D